MRSKPSPTSNALRVIAGTLRHRRFQTVGHGGTRETKDAVKEALFNALGHKVRDANVLDPFAGSGALIIEAFSRGAKTLKAIEKDPKAFRVMHQNFALLNVPVTTLKGDAITHLKHCDERFDVIFLDPPYDADLLEPVLTLIEQHALLKDEGCILVLHERDFVAPKSFVITKEKRYGRTRTTTLERKHAI